MPYCFRLGCEGNSDANSPTGVTAIYHYKFIDEKQTLPNEAEISLPFCSQECEVGFLSQIMEGGASEQEAPKKILGEIIKTHQHWLKQNRAPFTFTKEKAAHLTTAKPAKIHKVYSIRLKVPTSWEAGISEAIIELSFHTLQARLDFDRACCTTLGLLEYLLQSSF